MTARWIEVNKIQINVLRANLFFHYLFVIIFFSKQVHCTNSFENFVLNSPSSIEREEIMKVDVNLLNLRSSHQTAENKGNALIRLLLQLQQRKTKITTENNELKPHIITEI